MCWLTLDIKPFVNHMVSGQGWRLKEKLILGLRRKQTYPSGMGEQASFLRFKLGNLTLQTIHFLIKGTKNRNVTIQSLSALSIIDNDTSNIIGYGITRTP